METRIRREHNSNPLQRHSHVLVVFHDFPANPITGGVMTDPYICIHFGMCGHIIIMICGELMFLIHALLSTGIHTVHPCVVTCTDRTGDLHGMMWWMESAWYSRSVARIFWKRGQNLSAAQRQNCDRKPRLLIVTS